MNILFFLSIGFLLGYILRKKKYKVNLNILINVFLLLLIFFMGVEAGKIKINALWILGASILFALLTIAGSAIVAFLIKD